MSAATRREALTGAAAGLLLLTGQAAHADEFVTTPSGLAYKQLKKGPGGEKPIAGDLIAIRFQGKVKASGAVFDDILTSPEPYYTRVGSNNVLPAVEEAVKLMRTGDVLLLNVPGKLGFGDKGRPASPGRPRIPNNAELEMTLELVAVPGKDEEILEVNGLTD